MYSIILQLMLRGLSSKMLLIVLHSKAGSKEEKRSKEGSMKVIKGESERLSEEGSKGGSKIVS
jgi:hypothetical protein